MRSCASLIRSSRSPNFVAPVGQISAHAVALPATTRSGHIMHFLTRGFSDFHSYLGWANAQDTMQYRPPIHFQTSYTTGPSVVLWKAPTGHTDAHAGCSQCMHSRRMNLSSLARTTVYLCSDCTDSAATWSSYGSLFCCAQAPSHCLQPMHIVASYSRASLMGIVPLCSRAGFPFQGNEVRRRDCAL